LKGFIEIFPPYWRFSANKPDRGFVFDLQRFDSSEKTEEPTQRKQEESRKKGQVTKSAELSSVFVILAAFVALKSASPYIYEKMTGYMRFAFTEINVREDFTIQSIHFVIMNAGVVFMEAIMPVMLSVLVVSVVVLFLQVGFNFTPDVIMPQFSRINPISGFGRIFSKRSLVELVKSLVKISVVGYLIFRFIQKETSRIPALMMSELAESFTVLASIIYDLAFQIAMIILVLAFLDYGYQWWEHMQNLKMSKQEVKEEMKQTEGNPQVKGKIREKQRAMAMRRMMSEVPKADVVVTNPTHFAIAIKYEAGMEAPVVIAKGSDFIAQRIKEIAKENDIVIVENKPLAQTLFKTTEIGDMIPDDLYKAVAEVLAYVYRLKRKYS
jgi:flagellar biosynthetic protein FlhB